MINCLQNIEMWYNRIIICQRLSASSVTLTCIFKLRTHLHMIYCPLPCKASFEILSADTLKKVQPGTFALASPLTANKSLNGTKKLFMNSHIYSKLAYHLCSTQDLLGLFPWGMSIPWWKEVIPWVGFVNPFSTMSLLCSLAFCHSGGAPVDYRWQHFFATKFLKKIFWGRDPWG